MSIDTFIPTIWAARLLQNLNNAHVFKKMVNTEYEGEIKNQGDSVRINTIGHVTIKDYTKNGAIDAPETLQGADQTLLIDQAKYFNFEVDNIDKTQARPKAMNEAMREAAWGMADTMDLFLSTLISNGVAAANILTPLNVGTGVGDGNLYETIVDLETKLDINNTPSVERFCVISPAHHGLLMKDPRFTSFATSQADAYIRGKVLGEVRNFQIYKSNNLPTTSTILAGYKGAVTFADQISELNAFKPEGSFSDAVKELHVYGGKVTRPANLAKCVATIV